MQLTKKYLKMKKKLKKIKLEVESLTNDLRDKKNLASEFKDSKLKLVALRTIDGYVKKGKPYKFKSIYNAVLNEGTKINTVIFKLNKKLVRFKNKTLQKKLKGIKRYEVGFAWDTVQIENATLNNPDFKTVNGFNVKRDKDKILNLLNDLKLNMSAYETVNLIEDGKGNATVFYQEESLESQKNRFKFKPKNKR